MARNRSSQLLTYTRKYSLILIFCTTCLAIYFIISTISKTQSSSSNLEELKQGSVLSESCCRGIKHLELWGEVVKWGSEFKLNSSRECCMACKNMCKDREGGCLCNSWVYCGDRKVCGSHFAECWLKRQNDVLDPERRDSGNQVMWTSGLIFGSGLGVVGLETKYGTMHMKLLPDCAPHSVDYILQLVGTRHCAGCHFYRAEGRGRFWDSEGNHIKNTRFGPPSALIQGRLEAQGIRFDNIPTEVCPRIKRGSVGWVGSGPEFFISLANHEEWRKPYTVFGYIMPEDMKIAEKIAGLPSRPEVWSNINVSVLENFVPLRLRRAEAVPQSKVSE